MSGESAPYGEVPGEGEEEREEGGEEAAESLGLPYSWESPASWAALELQDGAVIEGVLEHLPGGEARPVAVFGISARLGERLYSARYLGTNDKSPPNRHRELGRLFNVRGGRVHLCLTGRRLCEVHAEEGVVHVEELMLYPPLAYEGSLCTTHGLWRGATARMEASPWSRRRKEGIAGGDAPRKPRMELLSPKWGWELRGWTSSEGWRT